MNRTMVAKAGVVVEGEVEEASGGMEGKVAAVDRDNTTAMARLVEVSRAAETAYRIAATPYTPG